MRIGTSELIVVVIVALLVLGPEKLPFYAKKLGRSLNTIKSYTNDFTKEINENVIEPVSKIKEPIENATKPLSSLTEELKAPFKETKHAVENMGQSGTDKIKESGSLENVS